MQFSVVILVNANGGGFAIKVTLEVPRDYSTIPGESEQNVGRLADCDIAFSHPIVVNEVFV